MKGPKRHRGLSGTVLIMILTVMVVLIIMLMATLSVVTTANQRIYTKFEENQAYYTARSALDVFTKNMLSDKKYYAQDGSNDITYVHGNNVTSDKMTQGLGLQLDLYSINTLKDDAGNDLGANVLQLVLTSYATGKSGSDEAKDEYKTYFGVTDENVTYLEYLITLPAINDGDSDPDGKFSGTGAADLNTVKIKVEVMDRTYGLGTYTDTSGAEATVPEGDEKAFVMGTEGPSGTNYSSISDSQKAEAIFNGVRKKDTMKLKITATTTFEGVEGKAVLIYDTNEPPVNNSSRAITSFGSMNGTNHAYIVGGISMMGDNTDADADGIPDYCAPMTNGGGIFGTVYDEVGLDFNVSSPIYLNEMEYIYVGGDFKGQNDVKITSALAADDITKRPFIYIAGTLYTTNNFQGIGGTNPNEKVDIITNGIEFTSNSFKVNGDIYCGGDAEFNSTAGTPELSGNLYIDGDLTVGGNCVTVTTSDEGAITGATLNFGGTGNVYVNGDVIYNGDPLDKTLITAASGITFDGANAQFPEDCIKNILPKKDLTTGEDDIGKTSDPSTPGYDEEKALNFEIDFSTFPGHSGSVVRKIETRKNNYDDYYAFETDGVTYKDDDHDGSPDIKSPQELAGVNFTDPSLLPANDLSALEHGNMTIDTTSDPTSYVLYGGLNFNGKTLEIKGGGTVELFLKPNAWSGGNYHSGNGQLDVIVDDDTTLKVYGADSNIEYTFDKVRFWTATTYDAYTHNVPIDAGSQSGHGIKVPKVYYYFDKGKVILNNGENFFTGYFFAPETQLESYAGSNMKFSNLKYNGSAVPSGWVYDFFGSVLVGDFNFQNDHGVVYINPALADDGDAGAPIHGWQAYRYARN